VLSVWPQKGRIEKMQPSTDAERERLRWLDQIDRLATALFRQLQRNQWRDARGRFDFRTVRAFLRVSKRFTDQLPPLPPDPPVIDPELRSLLYLPLALFSDDELLGAISIVKRYPERFGDPALGPAIHRRFRQERRRRAAAARTSTSPSATHPILCATTADAAAPRHLEPTDGH
jgi:hypothetical protein